MALFTGQSQERHGRVGYQEGVTFDDVHPVTLQGEFRRAGYQTQAIGKLHVYPERNRVGFDDVILHDGFLHYARKEHRRDFKFFDDYVPWLRRQPGVTLMRSTLTMAPAAIPPWPGPGTRPSACTPPRGPAARPLNGCTGATPPAPSSCTCPSTARTRPYDPPAWAMDMYLDLPAFQRRVGDWEHHYESVRTNGNHQLAFGTLSEAVTHRARAGYYGLMTQIDHAAHARF